MTLHGPSRHRDPVFTFLYDHSNDVLLPHPLSHHVRVPPLSDDTAAGAAGFSAASSSSSSPPSAPAATVPPPIKLPALQNLLKQLWPSLASSEITTIVHTDMPHVTVDGVPHVAFPVFWQWWDRWRRVMLHREVAGALCYARHAGPNVLAAASLLDWCRVLHVLPTNVRSHAVSWL